MKKTTLIKTMLLLCALVVGSSSVWADPSTAGFDLSSTTTVPLAANASPKTTTITGSADETWNVVITGTWTSSSMQGSAGSKYWQMGKKDAPITSAEFSTSELEGTISRIVVCCHSYNGVAKVNCTVGGANFGTQNQSTASSLGNITFTGVGTESGKIIVTIDNSGSGARAAYIQSITVTYTPPVETKVADLKISHVSGTYWGDQSVTITTKTKGASIYYTTDGSTPTASSSLYSSAIDVTADQTIKAVGIKAGLENSEIVTANYNIISSIPARNPKGINSNCFVKVTDVNELEDGDAVLIVNPNGDEAMGAQSSSIRSVVTVTSSAGVITDPSTSQKIVLIKAGNRFFFSTASDSYLYATSSSSNNIGTGNEATAGANAMAAVEIKANGDTSIDFMGSNTRNSLRYNYNSGSPRFSCYAASSSLPVAQIYKEIEVPASINITISSSGYSTLAKAFGLDFSGATPAGLVAYVASEISASAVTLAAVDEAPASTGVILKGTAGATYSIPVKADASFDGTNKLKAAVAATTIAANEAYIMQGGLFHKVTAASTVPAGKAYLLASDVPAAARELSFVFGDDETTGLKTVSNNQLVTGNSYFYDLQGRKVANPTKGLYIVNGKKVVIK